MSPVVEGQRGGGKVRAGAVGCVGGQVPRQAQVSRMPPEPVGGSGGSCATGGRTGTIGGKVGGGCVGNGGKGGAGGRGMGNGGTGGGGGSGGRISWTSFDEADSFPARSTVRATANHAFAGDRGRATTGDQPYTRHPRP